MALPDFDLRKIRLHEGRQDKAFEELCCQLASLELRPAGALHFRKGPGADAGVECFTQWLDGTETGWQVKFYTAMDASLTRSLDESIRTALKKHPNLTTYIVCLPFDLSDARTGRAQSPLKRWSGWRQKWLDTAAKAGRRLTIELWNESAIQERLGRDDPLYSGRLLYWFDQEALTTAWFRARFEKARADLGQRYAPETNVQLPVRRVLLAFTRDPGLNDDIDDWTNSLQEAGHRAVRACRELAGIAGEASAPPGLEERLDRLTNQLAPASIPPDAAFPASDWLISAREALKAARARWRWAWDQNPAERDSGPIRKADWARHCLMGLIDLIGRILEDLESERWRFANARQMLVYGDGGIGKSHLLADATAYQIGRSRPALLLLGSKFVDGEPWRQILDELDLPRHYQIKHFLGALDAAAQAAGTRAVIAIDALNERHGTDIWPHRLAGLLRDVEPFPRVAVALSCRTTYLDHVIPPCLAEDVLPRLEHHGFSGDAARVYLELRGFTLPGAPYLMPEFSNPLFLRTCCDALEKEGKREFPRGLRGVSAIFDFYKRAVSQAVSARLKLAPRRRIVERAVDTLAGEMVGRGLGYVPVDEAFRLLDEILPPNGARDRDLLSQLESEGMLTVEMTARADNEPIEEVRFTFERFSDHAIATNLLNTHLDERNPKTSFTAGTALHAVVAGKRAYHYAGVIDAIAIQLPERAGVELLDVVPFRNSESWYLREAFRESLLWRDQKHFTKRTLQLIERVGGDNLTVSTLVSIATEPDNRFNALYLHSRLVQIPMPKRDALWSTFIAQEDEDEGGPIEILTDWAWASGLSDVEADRAELAAVAITWFLTTTNRAVRDRATKALAALLAPRLDLAKTMIDRFEMVDDGYVLERLLAAIYGAAMQGLAEDGTVAAVAAAVYSRLFADGTPPVNSLIRDHGRGLIEYALWRGCLPAGIDPAKARPPYKSPWPIELVPDAVIEGYVEDHEGGRYRDQIANSSVYDGDFARYVIDYHVKDWSPAPIGTKDLPTDKDVREAWLVEFEESATPEMRSAYQDLLAAGQAASPLSKSPALQDAERAFRDAIGEQAWEDYRVRAQSWFGQGMFQFHPSSHFPAHFNLAWARRWICKRAHNLGWSAELHGEFDRSQPHPYSRHGHRIERIGKKYQWLALYELRARMADNLAFIASSFANEPQAYEGEWQGSLRDVDPSLLLIQTQDDGWTDWKEPTWWMPVAPRLRPIPAEDRLLWRDSPDDIVNGQGLIDVAEPGGRRWLTLYASPSWNQSAVINGRREFERQTWGRISCIVVRRSDKAKLIEALSHRCLTEPHALPKIEFYSSHYYLGEYPWHPAFSDFEDWIPPGNTWRGFPVPVRATVAEYICERGGYDYSIDQTVAVQLPAPWLVDVLKLRLSNGQKLTYIDASGTVCFFDPSVDMAGPRAALVDRDRFLSALEREGLAAVWIIAGEKGVFGGSDSSRAFGGRYVFTSVYWLENGTFRQHDHVEHQYPSHEQLKALLGKNPPRGAMIRR